MYFIETEPLCFTDNQKQSVDDLKETSLKVEENATSKLRQLFVQLFVQFFLKILDLSITPNRINDKVEMLFYSD